MSTSTPPPSGAEPQAGRAFDIGEAIDRGRWTGLQKAALALVSLVVVLDGFDNQLLGFSVPLIAADFDAPRSAFSWIFALGYVGVGIGTAVGGLVGDRIGRKNALLLAVGVFGVFTLLAALSANVTTLGIMRIIAGVGLGMVFPATAALIAEFTPLRRRSLAVALSIVCIPVGGLVGGLIAAPVLPVLGWRILFVVGGIAPLVLAAVLFLALPESPMFQAVRGTVKDRARLARTLTRLGHAVTADTVYVDTRATGRRAAVGELFTSGRRRDTLALWGAFFFSLLGVFSFYSWGPTLLVDAGFDLSVSSLSVSVYNLGAILLAIVGAWAMGRFGSKPVLISIALGAAVTGFWLFLVGPSTEGSTALFFVQLFLHGGFFAGLQTVLYSLAAQLYPVNIRATGVGAAGTVGRAGAILASFAGAVLLAAGGGLFFGALAIAGLAVAVALTFIRHHTKPVRQHGPVADTAEA